MYLHLGKGKIVSTEDIVGIFDLDITSQEILFLKMPLQGIIQNL